MYVSIRYKRVTWDLSIWINLIILTLSCAHCNYEIGFRNNILIEDETYSFKSLSVFLLEEFPIEITANTTRHLNELGLKKKLNYYWRNWIIIEYLMKWDVLSKWFVEIIHFRTWKQMSMLFNVLFRRKEALVKV